MGTKHVIAGIVVAGIAVFAAPAAASADSYIPGGGCSMSPATIHPGGSATYSASPGTFGPGQSVDYSVSGVDAAHVSLTSGGSAGSVFTSGADGSSSVSVTVPADASGTYQVTAGDAAVGVTCQCTLTVLPTIKPAVDPQATDPQDPSDPNELALTGEVVYTSLGWVGGGIVLAGVALLIWRRRSRRGSATDGR